jgi:hypothetical protein
MAPLPVIPNVVRVGIPWQSNFGVKPYNVFHVATSSSDLAQLALDIGDAMETAGGSLFGPVDDSYQFDELDLTPLDGTTPGQTFPITAVQSGGTGGDGIPGLCCVVSFRTAQRGPRGRGRVYLGPVSEGAQNNGILVDTGAVAAAWETFDDEMASSGSAASLVVASYVHSEANGVTSIVVNSAGGTQRRRQSRLR